MAPDHNALSTRLCCVLAMHLQLVLSAEQILKQQTTTYEEDISIIPQEEREPWTLPMSVFKPRAKESDAKAYHDNAGVSDSFQEQ